MRKDAWKMNDFIIDFGVIFLEAKTWANEIRRVGCDNLCLPKRERMSCESKING